MAAASVASSVGSSVMHLFFGGVKSMEGAVLSSKVTMVATAKLGYTVGETGFSGGYALISTGLGIIIGIYAFFASVLNVIFRFTAIFADLGANAGASDAAAAALLFCCRDSKSRRYIFARRFIGMLLRIPLLILFILFHLFRSFMKHGMMILLLLILTIFWLFVQTHSGPLMDHVAALSHLGLQAINIGTAGANIGLDVIDLVQPLTNAQIQYSVQSALQIISYFQSTATGRRLEQSQFFDTSPVMNQLQPAVQALAVVNTVFNNINLLIQKIFINYVYPIFLDLAPAIERFFVRLYCIAVSPYCGVREILQDTVGSIFNTLFSVFGASVTMVRLLATRLTHKVCDAAELQSFSIVAPPCVCAGQGIFNFQSLGIYSDLPACTNRRVLCDLKDSACESVDGVQGHCHSSAELGW